MGAGLRAGTAYFVLVFLWGSALGTGRTLFLEPRLGTVAATLIELPLMLLLSWWLCGLVLSRHFVPASLKARAAMGGLAFLLLMAAELGLSLYAVGGSVSGHFDAYREPAPLIGLAGQVLFALLPLVRLRGEAMANSDLASV